MSDSEAGFTHGKLGRRHGTSQAALVRPREERIAGSTVRVSFATVAIARRPSGSLPSLLRQGRQLSLSLLETPSTETFHYCS